MTLELITCPHCGYKYYTDLEKIIKDGEAGIVRSVLSNENYYKRKATKSFFIDLKCPNSPKCGKEFKWKVKT